MTKQTAIKRLIKTRTLTSNLLKPLNISFETFLRFSQFSKIDQAILLDKLIENLKGK